MEQEIMEEEIENQEEIEEPQEKPKEIEIKPFSVKIYTDQLSDIHNISKIIEEANIKLDNNGLTMKEIDNAMVCLIELSIPKEKFIEFDVDGETTFGINLKMLATVLKSSDIVTIESDGKKIIVKTDDDDKFELPIIEVSSDVPDIGQLKFELEFDVDLRKWRTLIDKAQLIGADTVTLEVSNGILKATAKQDYDGILKYEITLKSSVETKNAKSSYPMSYLKLLKFKMSRYFQDTLKLKFSKDYPLMIEKENLKVVLAPRVTDEE